MTVEDQVVTGEAVALDLRTASAGSRGIAALIDLAIMGAALIALLIVVSAVATTANDATVEALAIVAFVGVLVGYPVGMETLWRGRTLGKAAMGLRVVRDDGGPIRFRHALVRGLTGVVLEKAGLTLGFLAFVTIVTTRRHKRVGDMFAGTIVLTERVPRASDAAIQMPQPLAGWAAALDLSAVDDGLAMRARQLLLRAGQLSPDALAGLQHRTAEELVRRVGVPPPGAPDWAVLAAIVAERRRRALAASPVPATAAPAEPTGAPAPAAVSAPANPPSSGAGFTPPG